ncbi:MAG: hypothetical protein JWO76_18 [Nocardioides sp.]|nr:hypothetical protein [Nocardioides sp.]
MGAERSPALLCGALTVSEVIVCDYSLDVSRRPANPFIHGATEGQGGLEVA